MPLILRKLFRRRIVLAAAIALLVVVLVSLFAGPLIGLDPNETAIAQRLSQPSAVHLLGTDELGRDLFARIAFGGRYSLTIALLTALGSVVAGTLFGLAAGFFRRLDAPVMRVVDAMMSFPDILLAIALVGILGPSMLNVVLALVLVYTPRVARVVRASTLVVRELLFVEAARAVGVSTLRIIWRHILPNLMSPILVQASFIFARFLASNRHPCCRSTTDFPGVAATVVKRLLWNSRRSDASVEQFAGPLMTPHSLM